MLRAFAIQKGAHQLFLLVVLATTLISTVAASTPIYVGVNDISVTEDMSGKKLVDFIGDCTQILEAFTFNAEPGQVSKELLAARSEKDGNLLSKTISADMIGRGLRIRSAQHCTLQTRGYAEYLGKASKLAASFNFISVSKGMVGKSLQEVIGACNIEKILLYAPEVCRLPDEEKEGTECAGDYAVIGPEFKLGNDYLGKGIWVKAASVCTLDDGMPAEVLCSEAECAAKSGCVGNGFTTYRCANKECAPISTRECTAEEKAKEEGVNLVPELEVTAPAGIKGGSEIVVILKVKNTGTKSTSHPDIVGKCPPGVSANVNCGNTFGASVSFRKGDKYGPEAIQRVSAAVTHLGAILADSFSSARAKYASKTINPGASLEVLRETVKIPADFSGKLVISAVVDAENFYVETRENDNEAPVKEVEVQASSLANLVPTEAEAFPLLESLPATVSHVKVTVKNTGERMAVAEQHVGGGFVSDKIFPLKVSILKGNVEVCKGELAEAIEAGIMPNDVKRSSVPVSSLSGGQCMFDDKSSNYWAVVDVDNFQVGTVKGVFAESNENDNKQTIQLKGPQTCTPPGPGAREAGKYCSIATVTWLTQKNSGEQCSHNFECKTDLCIISKCVTETQKEQILKIVG